LHLQKKHLVWMGSIALLSIIIALASWLWLSSHHDKKDQFTNEKKRLYEIFTMLDSTYWENKDTSTFLCHEAIEISKKTGDSNAYAMALFNRARVYLNFDQSDSGLIVCNQSLNLANKVMNDTLIARIDNALGNYYLNRDSYYIAMLHFTKAYKTAEKIRNEWLTGLISNGLGLLYMSLEQYDRAIINFHRYYNISNKNGKIWSEAGALLNIGSCYLEKNDNLRSTYYNEKALIIAKQVNDIKLMCNIFINLGLINYSQKKNSDALNYFYSAMDYSKRINDRRIYGIILQDLGSFYRDNNQLTKAEDYFNKCLPVFSEIGLISSEMKSYLALSEIKKEQKQWQKAYQYHLRFVELRDSIQNTGIQKSISDYQYEIDLQKKQYEKELLQKKYEVQKRSNIILVITVLSIIILAGVIRKSLKKSIKLEKMANAHLQEKIQMADKIKELEKIKYQVELEAKNKELVSFSLQLTTKNDLLNEISKISGKYYNDNVLNKSYFNDLTKIIEDHINVDKEWGQFKILFEKVHHGFFNKLKQDYPELTEHELRFCAYIKINLGTKEIARMLNISPDTVRKSKYRLKKKLRLNEDTYIEDFLRCI
ncbi:MAG: tetratricopeptide repeat protein, partial [Bacteroidales bacterium]|nr:tetratricopeptide repeat protein [Bacteroidales bacterium]